MTENEAKEILLQIAYDGEYPSGGLEAFNMAIQALEEIQEHRAIGTIEEFKALKENQFFNFDSPVARVDKKSYDKAIDDFVKLTNEVSGWTPNCIENNLSLTVFTIHQIAEQLQS